VVKHDLGILNSLANAVIASTFGVVVLLKVGSRVTVELSVLVSEGLGWVDVFIGNSEGITV
jgi:hypothetical protein